MKYLLLEHIYLSFMKVSFLYFPFTSLIYSYITSTAADFKEHQFFAGIKGFVSMATYSS